MGTVADDTWYIIEAIDPGPNSVFEVAYFEYDRAYTEHLIRKIANLYNAKLDLIGLWHRHPGSFDIFSSTDNLTNAKYAAMRKQGAVSALVNVDPAFRITMYHVGQPCRYQVIDCQVGDDLIPVEYRRLKDAAQFRRLMGDPFAASAPSDHPREDADFGDFMNGIESHLKAYDDDTITDEQPEINMDDMIEPLLDTLLDDVAFLSDELKITIKMERRGKCFAMMQENGKNEDILYYSYAGKEPDLIFEFRGKRYHYCSGCFRKAFYDVVADCQDK